MVGFIALESFSRDTNNLFSAVLSLVIYSAGFIPHLVRCQESYKRQPSKILALADASPSPFPHAHHSQPSAQLHLAITEPSL